MTMTELQRSMDQTYDRYFGDIMKKSEEVLKKPVRATAQAVKKTVNVTCQDINKDANRVFKELFGDLNLN